MTQLVWPDGTTVERSSTDRYGPRGWTAPGVRAFHTGDDEAGYSVLRAIGEGTVVEVGWSSWAGNQVLIYLGEIDGVRTWVRYCHLAAPSPLKRGDRVARGQWVGTMGDTGVAFGIHLHWEVYRGRVDRGGGTGPHDVGTTIDPRTFVRSHLAGATPQPTPEKGQEVEEEMATHQLYATPSRRRALFTPGTGYFVPWIEGGATYANRFAGGLDTGDAIEVTDSLFDALRRGSEALLPRDRVAVEVVNVDKK